MRDFSSERAETVSTYILSPQSPISPADRSHYSNDRDILISAFGSKQICNPTMLAHRVSLTSFVAAVLLGGYHHVSEAARTARTGPPEKP